MTSGWGGVGIAIGVALVLLAAQIVARAERVLGWGLLAAILAALVWPLRNLLDRRLPRVLATVLSVLALIVAPVAFLVVTFRDVSDQFGRLRDALLEAARNVEASGRFADAAQRFHLTDQVERLLDTFDPTSGGTGQATSLASALVVVLVLTIFLVTDNGRIPRNLLRQIDDEDRRTRTTAVLSLSHRRWHRHVLALVAKAAGIGAVVFAMAQLLDVPVPTVVALVAAIGSVVPTVGTAMGSIPLVLLVAGFRSPTAGLVVAVLVVFLQVLDGIVTRRVIEPRSTTIGPIVPVVIGLVAAQRFGLGVAGCAIALAMFAMTTIEAIGATGATSAAAGSAADGPGGDARRPTT